MKIYKYANKENTSIQIFDSETGVTKQSLIERVRNEIEGKTIEPFETLEEIRIQRVADSKSIRDSLLENCAVEIRPGVWIKTRLQDETLLRRLIERLEPEEIYPNFSQSDPDGNPQAPFDVTREELEVVLETGENLQIMLRQQHALRIKEILAE